MKATAALLTALLAMAPPGAEVAADPLEGRFGGPFQLVDHEGAQRSSAEFEGRFMLVSFGYTSCPDICPLTLAIQSEALEDLGSAREQIVPLFITVDPARDTPEVLADYVALFDQRMIGLTGSEAEIAAVARSYRVHRHKVLSDDRGPEDYLVDHGSLVYLMGPDGGFLTLFPYGTPAARMAEIIEGYLAGPS